MSDLKIDWEGTKKMRQLAARSRKIKITINLDTDILSQIRKMAAKGGTPYQSYLNWLLRETVNQKTAREDRLDRLEKEVALIKKKIAA
jgi:predicted DNA binding CopG/RHH family protein